MITAPYAYKATVVSVHDGDTVHLDVGIGFYLHIDITCRLRGLNTRELKDPGGPEAREHLARLCPVGSEVLFRSLGPDKFGGRWLGVLELPDGRDVATEMIRDGYAAAWDGRGPKPLPPWPIPAR